jgi:hypothetical protein
MRNLALVAVLLLSLAGVAAAEDYASIKKEVADLSVAYRLSESAAVAMVSDYTVQSCGRTAKSLENFDLYLVALQTAEKVRAAQKLLLKEQEECVQKLAFLDQIKADAGVLPE